jgi:hypothetical protein
MTSKLANISTADLDNDALGLIIEQILLTSCQSTKRTIPWALKGEKKPLFELSLACKKLRASVAPWLFQDSVWPGNKPSVTRAVKIGGSAEDAPKVEPFAVY